MRYEITIRGDAGSTVRGAFPEFQAEVGGGTTTLRGDLVDQAALHGLLERARDLGIEIVEMRQIPPESEADRGART